jgi:hypothetical protein
MSDFHQAAQNFHGDVDVDGEVSASSAAFDKLASEVDANGQDINNIAALEAEKLSNNYLYAGSYDGSDPDERLDAALDDATAHDTLFLEVGDYTDNRTITIPINIRGGFGDQDTGSGSRLVGDWTIGDIRGVVLSRVKNAGTLTIKSSRSIITQIEGNSSSIVIDGGENVLTHVVKGSITLNGPLNTVDSCTQVTVTDNGSDNTVGDI